MQIKEYSTEIAGKKLTATFSDLADQANGSVMLRYGNTVVLATAVMSKNAREGTDFFPLTVDYEERFYATGKILGSRFVRREGRPSDEAILSGRVVDRTIRPLFPQYIRHDVQVVITVLSVDEDDPDILAVNAASLALATSDIPWNGPVGAVRIGKSKDSAEFVINPAYAFRESETREFDMVACGKDGNINMIEVGAFETNEETINAALAAASKEIDAFQKFQEGIVAELGKKKKVVAKPEPSAALIALFKKEIAPKISKAVFSKEPGKKSIEALKDAWSELFKKELPEEEHAVAKSYIDEAFDIELHRGILEDNERPDGRGMDDLRPIFVKAGGFSPVLHGSGIFYRGGTHILSALTLGSPRDAQIIDGMEGEENKRFMHHYNFPPFSVGETGRMGGLNRRMIGHGALAEKALLAVLPPKEKFPYTIRIVSEAVASNGSTSMGSVCGGTLSLMDAGVPISAPVAGIASGLMMEGKKHRVLTDIQGPEDHHGDMDFKVAGTEKGITAVQMDVKVDGIPLSILVEAFEKAKAARLKILGFITKEIATPRTELSLRAPRILTIKIKEDQIGLVIGTGGKTINEIIDTTGADIDIEDDGTVFITGMSPGVENAKKWIEDMTREYKTGERFDGVVTRILDFGAFVKIGHNAEGLVHISEISPARVNRVTDVLKEGDKVPVVVKEIDEKKRINLSIKRADPTFADGKMKGTATGSTPPSLT